MPYCPAPLHPEVQKLLADMKAAGVPALSSLSPIQARALLKTMRPLRDDGATMHQVFDLAATGPAGPIPVRIYEPCETPPATILYFHGGGWVIGGLDTSDFTMRYLAAATGLRLISGSYRLAPEHPFPAAAQDTYALLTWAEIWLRSLADDDHLLVIAGDSAGANLATVAALRAAESNGPKLAAQLLFYPVADADFTRDSYLCTSGTVPLSAEDMAWFWDQYVPNQADRNDPAVAPLRAASLASLPPTFVALADHDPLFDEGKAYAERLAAEGVPSELHVYPGTIHGFLSMPDRLESARTAVADLGNFLTSLGLDDIRVGHAIKEGTS